MQLSGLEIFGFKSFADKTKFIFDSGITGIVGPNGCGKSNIVDAVRWVLGEQKTRNLRSEKMENIIFNGTSKRKKANFAEVSLTFNNTKNILPTEFTTVSVTRKYYRDGESGYFINGVSCRLKDIQNLFLDTGIGPDSYAIIELKMVDEILNDKENSRRMLFEEAAGISKYKVRKKQTLKKLSDTQKDLDRVEDVLFEIDKNLKTLERQAKKTERYFRVKEKYKLVSSQHSWFKIRNLQDKFDGVTKEEQNFGDDLGAVQSTIAKHEARVQELKKEQIDNEKILVEVQRELNQHVEKIRTVETQKSIRNERLKFLQQREFAIKDQLDSEKKTRDRIAEELSQIKDLLEKVEKDFLQQEKTLGGLKLALQETKSMQEERKMQTENAAEEQRNLEQRLNQLKKELEIRQIQIQSLNSEMQRNEADKTSRHTEIDSFAEKLKTLETESAAAEKEVLQLKEKKEKNDKATEKTTAEIVELKDSIYKTNRGLDARQNEYNLTKSLVENLEGFPESVKFLKKQADWVKDVPLLSDIFSTSEDFKVAIENLLEPYLSYFVVDAHADAMTAIQILSDATRGRANFFILAELAQFKPIPKVTFDFAVPALEVVEVAEQYQSLAEYLLSHVYIVTQESGLPDDIPEKLIFINKTGNLNRRKYRLGGGSVGLFQGKRLGRAKNLKKLEKEIKELHSTCNEKKAKLTKLEKFLQTLKGEDFSKELDRKNSALQQKKQQLSVLSTREQEYREFIKKAGERSEVIVQQIEEFIKLNEQATPEIEKITVEYTDKTAILEEHRRMLENVTEEVTEKNQAFNRENITFIQLKNQFENLVRDQDSREGRLKQLSDSEVKNQAELEKTRKDIHDIVDNSMQNDDEIVGLYEEKKVKEQRTEKFEQISAQIRSYINQQEQNIRNERQRKEEMVEKKNEIRERTTEIKLQLNSLKERMLVEFKVEISDLDEEELFPKPMNEYDPEKVEKEMHRIREQLQNYGEVNPMAVEAYNEMKERFDFINEQKEDLIKAREILMTTIAEIDTTATEKFMESFHLIRDNFKNVFQALFYEGDTCDLILVDPNNPLDSKIDIIAKPKGKRPLTINQLSGGEKTLTATSLLFAIYLLKPAPFCIFDEVDAPLDDANIDKFNNIIKEFSKDSQFIIVTHNKRTMASTNVMYGVTMQESGVSKVLPVNLEVLNLS